MFNFFKIALIAYMFCALGQRKGQIFFWYQQRIARLPDWLRKPLGGCYMCFAGQLCLWYFVFRQYIPAVLVDCLFFVAAGILAAMAYNKIYCWLR